MLVGSVILVMEYLDWDLVFTTGLTQAATYILVQMSLSTAHLNFTWAYVSSEQMFAGSVRGTV